MVLRTHEVAYSRVLGLSLVLAITWLASLCRAKPQEQSARSTTDTVEIHLGRGYDFAKDQRYREAAKEFLAVLALDPEHMRARYQLAICWFALFQLNDARSEFERLRRETNGGAQVVYYLGRIDLLQANPAAAIREFKRIISNPPFEETTYYLGSAYLQKGDLPEAEKYPCC